MILPHSLLWGNIAEDVTLLLIVSTHVSFDALYSASSHNCWFFQQPASVCSLLHNFEQVQRSTKGASRPAMDGAPLLTLFFQNTLRLQPHQESSN